MACSDVLEQSLFTSMYKYTGKTGEVSQQKRRENFLKKLKEKRNESIDQKRNISEYIVDTEEMDVEESEFHGTAFKFELMLSEWFTDIPEDLEESWLVKLCPDGVRTLLIAKNKKTKLFYKNGKIATVFCTNLPGGGKMDISGLTVLDCVYHKDTRTIFVLDCLSWNSMSMLDSEAQFRSFWLKSKFQETPSLTKCSRKYHLKLLEFLPANRTIMQDHLMDVMQISGHEIPCNGVVFYHKNSHYAFGYTPLVGWLTSFMLSEKLSIDVNEKHLRKKPKDYQDMEQYLAELCDNTKKKSKIKDVEMADG